MTPNRRKRRSVSRAWKMNNKRSKSKTNGVARTPKTRKGKKGRNQSKSRQKSFEVMIRETRERELVKTKKKPKRWEKLYKMAVIKDIERKRKHEEKMKKELKSEIKEKNRKKKMEGSMVKENRNLVLWNETPVESSVERVFRRSRVCRTYDDHADDVSMSYNLCEDDESSMSEWSKRPEVRSVRHSKRKSDARSRSRKSIRREQRTSEVQEYQPLFNNLREVIQQKSKEIMKEDTNYERRYSMVDSGAKKKQKAKVKKNSLSMNGSLHPPSPKTKSVFDVSTPGDSQKTTSQSRHNQEQPDSMDFGRLSKRTFLKMMISSTESTARETQPIFEQKKQSLSSASRHTQEIQEDLGALFETDNTADLLACKLAPNFSKTTRDADITKLPSQDATQSRAEESERLSEEEQDDAALWRELEAERLKVVKMLEEVMYSSQQSQNEMDYESARNIFKKYETLRNRIDTARSSRRSLIDTDLSLDSGEELKNNTFLKNLENLDKAFGEHQKKIEMYMESTRRGKGGVDVVKQVYMSNFMSFREKEPLDYREPGDPSLFKKKPLDQITRNEEVKRIIEEEKRLSQRLGHIKNQRNLTHAQIENLTKEAVRFQGSNLHRIISKSGKETRADSLDLGTVDENEPESQIQVLRRIEQKSKIPLTNYCINSQISLNNISNPANLEEEHTDRLIRTCSSSKSQKSEESLGLCDRIKRAKLLAKSAKELISTPIPSRHSDLQSEESLKEDSEQEWSQSSFFKNAQNDILAFESSLLHTSNSLVNQPMQFGSSENQKLNIKGFPSFQW